MSPLVLLALFRRLLVPGSVLSWFFCRLIMCSKNCCASTTSLFSPPSAFDPAPAPPLPPFLCP